MDFTGFKLQETSLKGIRLELKEAQNKIDQIALEQYHILLGEEIAFLADCVSLGILNRQDSDDLFQIGEENLRKRIAEWNCNGYVGPYNFAIYGYFFPYGKNIYLQLDIRNPLFKNAFSYLQDYSLSAMEMENPDNPKTKLWLNIMKEKDVLFTVNFSPDPKMDKEKIVFPSKKDRIYAWSRHQITNERLNQYSGGKKIPPYQLMRYLDHSMEDIDYLKEDLKSAEIKLSQILLDFKEKKNLESLKSKESEEKSC